MVWGTFNLVFNLVLSLPNCPGVAGRLSIGVVCCIGGDGAVFFTVANKADTQSQIALVLTRVESKIKPRIL
jgi:hypothetical protein